ncbi:MAG TPA: ABC transporter permease [Opitutaceae bacterium]|nr:ABC transporter permease [Opitutaceae bacterium]
MIGFDTLVRDVRYAFRSLRRDLGATVFIVAIAGIGIGASTTVFSICRALILRPLPFEHPERLVWIANGVSENLSAQTVQVNNLLDLRAGSGSWTDIAGFFPFYAPGDIRLTGAAEPERLTGVPVTQTFFPLLGVKPLVGRFFDDAESRDNGPKTVVLSHDFWQRRFAGDGDIVGRAIVLNGGPVTVIGVLPPSFDFAATFTPGRRADVFLPFPLSSETNRRGNTLALIGRLRDGVALEAAQVEAAAIGSRIVTGREGNASRNGFAPRLMSLRERVSGRFQSALFVLAGAVSFLMLLVCANLSNLLLVRASNRRREMAIRTALGAPRRDLVRQMLVESLVLNAGGALLGIALAATGTIAVSRLQGTTIPLLNAVRVDTAVLGFTVLIAVVTGIAFGLLPALHASSFTLPTFLTEGSRGSARSGRVRNVIVAAEVALVCVLLTGAGLLGRSLGRVLDVRPGFSTDNVVAIRVDPGGPRRSSAQTNAYFDAVVREVRSVPGVQSLGLTDALPLGDNFGWRRWDAVPAEKAGAQQPEERINPLVRMVDEGYLAAMQIPLRRGRAFRTSDANSEPVIIVNERLARVLWPGVDAIGRVIRTSGKDRRVIGVVGDVRYFGLDREADMEMYMPIRTGDYQSVDLVVRASLPPAALTGGIRAALRRVDPTLPVAEFRSMEQLVDRSVFARRFVVLLVGGFAAFGLLLASLGIYAVISYSVTQRTQEIGIRMALGATPGKLRAHILGQTARLALLGVAVGLPASWLAARAIRSLLFDVRASDPPTYIAVLVILVGVAALAGYVPARRATHVDPAIALRPR